MDAASLTVIIDFISQPIVIFVLVLFLMTGTGKLVIRKIKEKYLGTEEEEDDNKHCNLEDLKNSPILKAYIDKEMDKMSRINQVYRYDRVQESHILIRRLSDNIKRLMVEHFRKLTSDKREHRAYDHILNTAFEPVRDDLRMFVKRNRLLERSESDYRIYCETTAKEIMSKASESIDDEYYDEDFSITRDEVRKSDYKNIGREILDLIEDTLFEIREVFKLKDLEIQKIKDEE